MLDARSRLSGRVGISERGRDWLAELEGGYRLEAYRDSAGVWTISAGLTRVDGVPVKAGDSMDLDQASVTFRNTLEVFGAGVSDLTRKLEPHQLDSIIALAYNIGLSALGRSTVLRRINSATSTTQDLRDAWLMWVWAGGKRSRGLRLRRLCELELYTAGRYLTQGDPAILAQLPDA